MYTPLLKKVIYGALDDAMEDKCKLNEMYLFKSIFDDGEGVALKILLKLNIDINGLYGEIKINNKLIMNDLNFLNLGINMNEEVSLNEKVIGREDEIELIVETLIRKNKNNPLLIGEAGVGKTALVEELARRIKMHQVPKELDNKIIVNIELASLLSGTKYRGEFEEKLIKIIEEVEKNDDVILFIDEIHGIVNAGGADGAINAADILKPYLARGKIKIIGATTFNEYNKYFSKDKALSRRFEVIKILEPTNSETINILSKVKDNYEKYYGIKITKRNINDLVELTSKYVLNRHNPDKSLDMLDSLCARIILKNNNCRVNNKITKLNEEKEKMVKEKEFEKASIIKEKIIYLKNNENKQALKITKNDILELISKKYSIPLIKNKNKLMSKLKKELSKKIIGQDDAINEIVNTLEKKDNFVPLSLLLMGPVGVGKTTTVKEIANIMKMNLIRIDMNEFIDSSSVARLIGSPAGYVGYEDGNLLNKINLNPSSIILLDEVDKCCSEVKNIFLQILDEGYLINAKGDKLNFNNSLIFMTCNNDKVNKIGFENEKQNSDDDFNSKFISRIDKIIKYKSINRNIVNKYLDTLGIKDKSIGDKINYQKYGLREVKKYVTLK